MALRYSLLSAITDPTAAAEKHTLVVATRLHLGNASAPPSEDKLDETVRNFLTFCKSCSASRAAIAVDATPKIEGYDFVLAVQRAAHTASLTMEEAHPPLEVLPVTPWGKFVPALNSLISYAATKCHAHLLLFVSAETKAASITPLIHDQMDDSTLVVGAVLPGHDFSPNKKVALTGRTTPWNTLAVWNLHLLALTGFPLVSDGLHPKEDGSDGAFGVEEVAAIALLQKVLGEEQAKAKLVKLPGVSWDQQFEDEERRKWHETKMKSKVERAQRHLELTGLSGWVYHCE